MEPYEILILAAGSSSRLGQPKQLLSWQGNSLIRRTALLALAVHDQVRVVLGAKREQIEKEVLDLPVSLVVHESWEQGMGSSLNYGLQQALESTTGLQGVLVLLVDQPYIEQQHLVSLIPQVDLARSLVATQYDQVVGVPAFIGSHYFQAIKALSGDQGARSLFSAYKKEVTVRPFAAAAIDIDTMEDWQNFINDQT